MMDKALGYTSFPIAGDLGSRYLAAYDRDRACAHEQAAKRLLLTELAEGSEQLWLQCARALVLRCDVEMAGTVLFAAVTAYPDSIELRFALAGIQEQTSQLAEAEISLRHILQQQPDHVAATFLLAHVLTQQGRIQAAAVVVHTLFDHGPHDIATVIQAVELLDDCGRKRDAATLCEAAITDGQIDARIHAYAGMLKIQLGEFERARQHYSFALSHSTQALEWNIPMGLSRLQRYLDSSHPDFNLFREALQRHDLNEKARMAIHFALGKAHDDLGDYAQAARYLRQANAMKHATLPWSRKRWHRSIVARMTRAPLPVRLPPPSHWTPLFIVGVMRSGTTLLAELLSHHPDVCNRGELPHLPVLAQKLSDVSGAGAEVFAQAAITYERQLRQDDSSAHWFIDKHPMNLLNIDLIMALWPHARVIYCRRNPRDTALSLWSQLFIDDTQGYAYDFADIAAVIKDCARLMTHWQKRYARSIYTISYEQLTAETANGMAALADWLGLPPCDLLAAKSPSVAISTASLWQARQPVYTASVERWRHYTPYLPELLRFSAK